MHEQEIEESGILSGFCDWVGWSFFFLFLVGGWGQSWIFMRTYPHGSMVTYHVLSGLFVFLFLVRLETEGKLINILPQGWRKDKKG